MPWFSPADRAKGNPRLLAFDEGLAHNELAPQPPNSISEPKPELKRDDNLPVVRPHSMTIAADGLVVLDLEHDRLLKLNPVGAEMWKLLAAGSSESSIIEFIAQRYQVDRQRVAADFRVLLDQIAELGVEVGRERPREQKQMAILGELPSFPWYGQDAHAPRPQPRTAIVCCAVLGLALVDLILWITSIKSLCWAVKGWPLKKCSVPDPGTVIGQVCGAVEIGCVWYPRRTMCLQRSVVTTCLLRCHGIPARMIIGARPMPFLSHAWVEANGSVVNDWPKVKNVYQMLASY
jgi:hypothetical protein